MATNILSRSAAMVKGTLRAVGAVTLDSTLTVAGLIQSALGVQVTSVARTATAAGTTTGLIADGTSFVTVTSDDANKIITLPAPTPGHVVRLINAATGYELRSSAPATVGINGGVGADAESAIAANTYVECRCTTPTNWVCNQYAAAGTAAVTQVAG